jgi:hypothetical protein
VPAEFLAGLALAHADILKVCLDPVYVVRVDALRFRVRLPLYERQSIVSVPNG